MENFEKQETAPNQTSSDTKWIGIVAYLTFIGWIISLVMKNNAEENKTEFNAFHVRQSLGILLGGIAVSIVNIIPILGQIVWVVGMIFLVVCWFIGFLSALQGTMKEVPVVGKYFQDWFKNL